MKIAVLMSTYNGEKYIREQIDSILNQNGDFQIDLWVRDDGSKDHTRDILDEYLKRGQLYWYSGCNCGPTKSFLELLQKCGTYDFYAFSDQDDYWMKNKLASGIKNIYQCDRPALYCANASLVDESLQALGRNVYRSKPCLDFYTISCAGGLLGCTMIFNEKLAEIVRRLGIPQKAVLHDFYIAQLCTLINGVLIYDDRAYIKYRQHHNNVVGVSYGFWGTLCGRFKDMMTKQNVSIAEQSGELLQKKGIVYSEEYRWWLSQIAEYRESTINQIKLAISRKTKYINLNMSIKLRISILLGNR